MSNTNICWECRHSKLKLKILVPRNSTIKEYINKTYSFQPDVVEISKEKQGQYNVWFRSRGNLRLLSFKILQICKLKQEHENTDKVGACENYDLRKDQDSISNIVYGKTTTVETTKGLEK